MSGHIAFRIDREDGPEPMLIASDAFDCCHGCGDTVAEAVADWFSAATEMLADLEAAELSPLMRVKRDALRRMLDGAT